MMDEETQLKVQALLDGELPEAEAKRMEAFLRATPEAQALLDSLKLSQTWLADFEKDLRVPESREFYWSKIERQLTREPARGTGEVPSQGIWLTLRRWLMPAGAVAVVALTAWLAGNQAGLLGTNGVPQMESALADSGAFTYRDFSSGTTLVWLSYPAEK